MHTQRDERDAIRHLIDTDRAAFDKSGEIVQTRLLTYIVVVSLLLLLPLQYDPSFLQGSAGDQAGSHVPVTLSPGLPPDFNRRKATCFNLNERANAIPILPVSVVLADDVENIALRKV